jgi:hypothetical protein
MEHDRVRRGRVGYFGVEAAVPREAVLILQDAIASVTTWKVRIWSRAKFLLE